jgi:hypothetical protein
MYLKPRHSPNACILVLEEDPTLRAALCDLLVDAGYAIADAQSGAVGPVDLVLAGIGARRAAPASLSLLKHAVPAIALVDRAAWTGFGFFDAANELGAVAVLQRPFSRAALLQLMATVLSDPEPEIVAPEDEDGAADETGPADFLLRWDRPHVV